jgi:hypothetical protein
MRFVEEDSMKDSLVVKNAGIRAMQELGAQPANRIQPSPTPGS